MERFTGQVFDLDNLSLFNYFKQVSNPSDVWRIINHINILEVDSLKKELSEKEYNVSKILERLGFKNSIQQAHKWTEYMLSRESEALFIFLFSHNPSFMDNFLKIKGKKYLENIFQSKEPVIFISPHWGAFYSIPLILSALGVPHVPISNAGEENHLNTILNQLVPEHKDMITDVLSTSNPILLLKNIKKILHLNQSILIYPEYTFGSVPKARATYFGVEFPAPQGVPRISVTENTRIQPLSFRKISDTPKFEIVFYEPIIPASLDNNVESISKKIHTSIENIVKSDVSQWWYWEIFEENSKISRGSYH